MKKFFAVAAAMVISLSMAGCGENTTVTEESSVATTAAEETEPETEADPESVTKTDYVEIEGIYVDSSYVSSENENLKLVYVFYNTFTDNENLKVCSDAAKLTVNDVNTYDSQQGIGKCEGMGSYYYSKYLKDVYVGDSLKIVSTFLVPEGDLEGGRTLNVAPYGIPDADKVEMSTDDIVFCESSDEVASIADPEGYADQQEKLQPADEETTAKVRDTLNGNIFEMTVNNVAIEYVFSAPDNFEVQIAGTRVNGGKYVVTKGYVSCIYDGRVDINLNKVSDDSGEPVNFPWNWAEDGSVEMHPAANFAGLFY